MKTVQLLFLRLWQMKYGKVSITLLVILVLGFATHFSSINSGTSTAKVNISRQSSTATPSPSVSKSLVFGGSYTFWLHNFSAAAPVQQTTYSVTYISGFGDNSFITITETNNIVTTIKITFPSGTFTSSVDTYSFCLMYMPTNLKYSHTSGNIYYWSNSNIFNILRDLQSINSKICCTIIKIAHKKTARFIISLRTARSQTCELQFTTPESLHRHLYHTPATKYISTIYPSNKTFKFLYLDCLLKIGYLCGKEGLADILFFRHHLYPFYFY